MRSTACRRAWLLLFFAGMLATGWAQNYVRVGWVYQINTVVDDGTGTPSNPVPKYNAPFQLLWTTSGAPSDTSVFKIWKWSDNPTASSPATPLKYYGPADQFISPVNSSTLDKGYGAQSGYSYFFILSTVPDTYLFSIRDVDADKVQTFFSVIYYEPTLRWFDSTGAEITDASSVSLKTGEYMKVTVRAYMPNGQVDSGFSSAGGRNWLVPNSTGDAANIQYYNVDNLGQPLSTIDSVKLENGEGTFFIKSDEPVNGDAFTFRYTFSSYVSSLKPQGSATFPVDIQISYGDAPMLDSAAIYDKDGDGMGDEIRGWFDMAVDTKPTSPLTSWPVDTAFVPVSAKTITMAWTAGAESITVNTDEKNLPTGVLGTGDFRVTVTGESGNQVVTTAALKDRIGPVLQSVTLIPGRNGDPDTLVARFNKEIDSTFTSGDAFLLNGDALEVSGEKVAERTWRFVVEDSQIDVKDGDGIKLKTDGGIESYNGNLPASNNQEITVREARTLPDLAEGSGFYDTNGDGKMDSIGVVFAEGLDQILVDSLDFRFVWLDSKGNPIELKALAEDLVWSETHATRIGWKVPDSLDVMPFLTSINSESYGYGNVLHSWEVNGDRLTDTVAIPMSDFMSPVLKTATIWPVSNNQEKGDSLALVFSEPVDASSIGSLDFLDFMATGDADLTLPVSKIQWSDSGRVLGLRLGSKVKLDQRPNPGDSIRILDLIDGIQDLQGNSMQSNGPWVQMVGDARMLQATNFHAGVKDRTSIGENAKRLSNGNYEAIELTYLSDDATLADAPSGTLGILVDVGQSTLGNYDSLLGTIDLDLNEIGLEWRLDIFTNLGGFVASQKGKVMCSDTTSTGYNGNCFVNRKQLYISWNLLSESGRKAGYGVYAAKLTLDIRGKKPVHAEKVYLWGVSSTGLKGGSQ